MSTPEPIPDLLKAVNEASGKAFALWITFLTIGTYLAIAIGTTTHLQLLLAGPVKLPLLGVDLPLFAFYGFASPLFVVLHLYVLMQLYLLARLLRLFDGQLRNAKMTGQDRRMVRGQLDKFVFTQYLIGVPQDRIVLLFVRMVVWLSFVIGPVLLLLGFQLRFLPYHDVPITYVHRVVLLLDIMLLLLFWPKISGSGLQPERLLHGHTPRWRLVPAGLCGAALVAFSFFIATVPSETTDLTGVALSRLLPFSRTIQLSAERLVEPDEEKLSKLARTLSLRDRDFRQAALQSTDFRKADLRATDLGEANFLSADLRGADLRMANLDRSNLKDADLRGANLQAAKIMNANLGRSNLGSADLLIADLSACDLHRADLSAANLNFANLAGANLTDADLRDAKLGLANLINADLRDAKLDRANLSLAILHDAKNLTQAQLDQACGTDARLPEGLTLKPCQSHPFGREATP